MAEDANTPEPGDSADPVAIGAAIGRSSPAIDAELIAYLHDQRHHLNAQRLATVWEKWLGVFLRAATACVGVAVAGGFGVMIWRAAHSDGLKVEPFNVPPTMIERGLTGEVVAARVIDRLSVLQFQTNTARPARSYSNAWAGQSIKLEIPETGISLGQLDSWLLEKFGHETPLTGDVVRTKAGVTLTARAGDGGAVSVSGNEADMDALTGRLAEGIYRLTQPYRYAVYLLRHENRPADAARIFEQLTLHGSAEDKRWSHNMWAQAAEFEQGDNELGLKMYQQALAEGSNQPYANLLIDYVIFGRIEEALQSAKASLAKSFSRGAAELEQAAIDMLTGGYRDALRRNAELLRNGAPGFPLEGLMDRVIKDQIGEHDLAAARVTLAGFPRTVDPDFTMDLRAFPLEIDMAAGNWRGAIAHEDDMTAYVKAFPHNLHAVRARFLPSLALAHARLGELAAAERVIAPTPGDCYPCLIARAQIAELAGQRARAEYWFTRADAAGPSLPFAAEAEGRALLERAKPDQAIARFTIANRRGPHFADPLEGWGEALVAKNQSHLAVAKFTEADKYAPNWGRLHLEWGEALVWTGKPDEARAQFARAAALDLSPSEKSELALMHNTAK